MPLKAMHSNAVEGDALKEPLRQPQNSMFVDELIEFFFYAFVYETLPGIVRLNSGGLGGAASSPAARMKTARNRALSKMTGELHPTQAVPLLPQRFKSVLTR